MAGGYAQAIAVGRATALSAAQEMVHAKHGTDNDDDTTDTVSNAIVSTVIGVACTKAGLHGLRQARRSRWQYSGFKALEEKEAVQTFG